MVEGYTFVLFYVLSLVDMSSLERTPHLQGLQIDDGALCDPQATRLWLAAFMLREAILIAPDNFVPAEEALYFTNIARFIVSMSSEYKPDW